MTGLEIFVLLTVLLFPTVDHVPEKYVYFPGEEPSQEFMETYYKNHKH